MAPNMRFLRNACVVPFFLCATCAKKPAINWFADTGGPIGVRSEVAANPNGDVASVYRLWAQYLESSKKSFGCPPSEYWLDAEQLPYTLPIGHVVSRCADLATKEIWPPNQPYEILSIERVSDTRDTLFQVTTRFRDTSAAKTGRQSRVSLTTVFAVRHLGQWKLSGSLVQRTRSWHRETVGPFTYIVSPALKFSRSRAESAAKFADSLSVAFGVPRLRPLDYYLVRDGDDMMRLKGLERDTVFGTPGAQSLIGIIISGDTVFGENHGHEIVHNVLMPLVSPNLNIVASEGVPTWLGGTRSMRYPQALKFLGAYVSANPNTSLDQILTSNANPMFNPSAALLAHMVHERRGNEGIRQFMDSGPSLDEFKAGVERIVGMPWSDIATQWKRRALAAATTPVP